MALRGRKRRGAGAATAPPDPATPIGVAFFPPPKAAQPAGFVSLLCDAVEAQGARRVRTGPLSLGWAMRDTETDVIHLHWLEYVAAPDPAPVIGWLRTWLRIARLMAILTVRRRRGCAVVWTIHNLSRHEPVRPRAEAILSQLVYLLADEVIVHSEYAAARVRGRYRGRRRRPATVIPHANYEGAFPPPGGSRAQIRAELGLPDGGFVYLAFGVIRAYKRLGLLAETFRSLPGEELRLLIAGAPSQPEEVARLEQIAAGDRRIVIRADYIPDEEVTALHLAADAAVIGYADVFSSGALLLALSLGVPALAPADGTARELFAPPAVEFFSGEELRPGLERIRHGDRRAEALQAAARFPWEAAGAATVSVYRRAIARRARITNH